MKSWRGEIWCARFKTGVGASVTPTSSYAHTQALKPGWNIRRTWKELLLLVSAVLLNLASAAADVSGLPPMHAEDVTPLAIPAPQRVLGPTQIREPKAVVVSPVALEVTIDTGNVENDLPRFRKWGENAAVVCQKWYPIICQELGVKSSEVAHRVTLIFASHLPAPAVAYASGDVITIGVENLSRHFTNYGMVVHELVHVVQKYPNGSGVFGWLKPRNHDVGWLTEGIADYVRFYLYEADPSRGGIEPGKSSYTDSYRSTACFLDYLVRNYDATLIKQLNDKLHHGRMNPQLFEKMLREDANVPEAKRRDVTTLYSEFITAWTQSAGRSTTSSGPKSEAVLIKNPREVFQPESPFGYASPR